MFDSLDEQIRKDENKVSSPTQRYVMYALYLVGGLAVFGGLIYAVHMMSGT